MSELLKKLKEGDLGDAILRKLKDGETPTSITKWIQGDLLEYTEFPEVRIASTIKQMFNEAFTIDQRLSIVRNRGAIRETVAQHREAMDTEEELTRLYYLQIGRIEQEHSLEKKINKLMGGLGNEIELARRIANDIQKNRQESGLAPRAAQKIDITTNGQPLNELTLKLGILAKRFVDSESNRDVQDADFKEIPQEEPPKPQRPLVQSLTGVPIRPVLEDISDTISVEGV